MNSFEVGQFDLLTGKIEGIDYSIFCMKEPEYVIKLFTTYGTLNDDTNAVTVRKFLVGSVLKVSNFFYTTCFSNHFKCRHAVDNHNNLRHRKPSFEETWMTHRWENQVFAFYLLLPR